MESTRPRIAECHEVQNVFGLLDISRLKDDAVESSEQDVVDQRHFGCVSRRTRLCLPLMLLISYVRLLYWVILTSRAARGVESSLYGPSAHFLVDILRIEGMEIEEGMHSF